MFKCCGARWTCQGRDWRHDQDNGRQANQGRTLEMSFLDHYKTLLWRKQENERNLCCLSFWVVTFILFEHKVHSPCEHKVIHVVPLQPGDGLSSSNDSVRASPAILSSYNSASLSEDAQGGPHSCEVLSRTIKLDILLEGLDILLK